jgi:hypothetical protein
MSKEAMQMALEALEGNCTNPSADPEQAQREDAAITALRKALETEKQEPVAWANSYDLQHFDMKVRTGPDLHHTVPLYIASPKTEQEQVECMCGICKLGKRKWVGLTDDDEIPWDGVDAKSFARAIEAKLKDKNHG